MESERVTDLTSEVRALVETMYAGYLTGDRTAIDEMLSPGLTMFDSASLDLIAGLDELQTVRDARPGTEGIAHERRETSLTPDRFTAREVGSVVVATWWLTIAAEDLAGQQISPEMVRNTAVLMRGARGSLLIEHIHEDVIEQFGVSAA